MSLPQDARKQDLNRRLETVSWGLFLIMLGLNAVRMLVGIRASWFTLIIGTIALLSGLGSVLGVDIPVGPVLIILIGLAIVVRALQPRW
jgi:hypothetical protein